jgi:hypothetical protein
MREISKVSEIKQSTYLRYWTQWRHLLQIREDWGVLNMNQEINHQKNIAV